jgi:hypothetical protein
MNKKAQRVGITAGLVDRSVESGLVNRIIAELMQIASLYY